MRPLTLAAISAFACVLPAAPQRANIEDLVKKLGSDRFEEREAACKSLEAIGEPALPFLRKATRSDNPEVRRRATEVVQAVEHRLLGPVDPALEVMLREPAQGDRRHRQRFFTALASLAKKHQAKPEVYLIGDSFVADGFAVRIGADFVVAVLREDIPVLPGEDRQHLLLLDRHGKVLDHLSCAINNRLTKMAANSGIFRTEMADTAVPDEARLVVRYLPEIGGRIAGNWSHEIVLAGERYTYSWDQDRPDSIRSAEWEKKGLCRVAIRGGRFSVAFPTLKEAIPRR
jgi:hypothetical protein